MDVFDLRARLVADYQSYTRSFIKIRDERISSFVDHALTTGAFWPEPLLQLNPTFLPGGTIDDLVAQKALHEKCFRALAAQPQRCSDSFCLRTPISRSILFLAEWTDRGAATTGE